MRYGIVLASKYTGGSVYLGVAYATREEAEAYIKTDVCEKCNYAKTYPISDDTATYRDKRIGFRNDATYNKYHKPKRSLEGYHEKV